MIRTSPFHERTSALNESGLWSHWSGHLAAEKYGLSDKFEYFAVRNAAGLFDTSPLFKYRFAGPGAEAFLAGVLARDPRALAPGHGMYAIWCDDRGFVVEDGVLLRHAKDEFVLTAAEPNLAYFAGPRHEAGHGHDRGGLRGLGGAQHPGPAGAADRVGAVAVGRGAAVLRASRPAKAGGCEVSISRTGYTGDLGYEIWVPRGERAARRGTRSGRRPAGWACCRSASRRCT